MLSERIIVVNPNQDVLKNQEPFLREHEIIHFLRGKDFLLFWEKNADINLVLLDVSLSDVDAFELLHEVKSKNKDVFVIMTALGATKEMIVRALRSHADDFWDGPMDGPDLREKVDSALKNQEYHALRSRSRKQNIDRIKRFIQRNYQTATLDFISKELFLSSKYVSRMFSEKNGVSFREYKIQVKLKQAKDLLTNTSLRVSAIASELGYKKPEAFMRVFKRMTQKTPRQYRQETQV